METDYLFNNKLARAAGITYLLTTAIFIVANFTINSQLRVDGDAIATARNILANQFLFRLGVLFTMLYCLGNVIMLCLIYFLLRSRNSALSAVMALCRLIYALVYIVISINCFFALRLIVSENYLKVFETSELQALARVYLYGYDSYYVGLLFWSISSGIMAYLLYQCGFVKKPLAIFGILSAVWCAFCTIAYILNPDFSLVVDLSLFDIPMLLFEIIISVAFLFKKNKLKINAKHNFIS